ncbi:MAG: hypothetical protein HY784_00890, partial [Chloroflexi bacterium]|nr:hypothetical protein [Chloroflexota bacterium]
LAALLLFPLGVRAFATLFVGRRAAVWAGRLAIVLPGLALSAYAFGQLPTVAASVAGLFALSCGGRYLRAGRLEWLGLAILCAGVMAGAHHAVFLLAPCAAAALVGRELASALRGPAWRQRLPRLLLRAGLWAGLSGLVTVLALWPFLSWSRGYLPQAAIEHPSRSNFLLDPWARLFFFYPMYGWLLPLLPALLYLAAAHRRLLPLGLAGTGLFLLGLGGTTPFPEVLFGANWQWLTYDRFAFWAGICALPLAGALCAAAERAARRGRWLPAPERRRAVSTLLAGALVIVALLAASLSVLAHSQPPAIDMQPIVDWLAAGDRSQWRYLTFGFGDQLAALSILTPATTLDGSYHTARRLPELRQSGIGQIDTALWSSRGVDGAYVFMENAGKWGVRWAFVNNPRYTSHLQVAGWRFRERLGNGVEVWETRQVPPRAAELTPPPPAGLQWAGLWWGLAPPATLAAALLAALWRLGRGVASDSRVARAEGGEGKVLC